MTEATISMEQLNQNSDSNHPEMASESSSGELTLGTEIQPVQVDNLKDEQCKTGSDNEAHGEVLSSLVAPQMSGDEDHKQGYSTDEEMLDSESYATAGDASGNAADGEDDVISDKVACKFYMRSGRCHFGKKCRYSHDVEEVAVGNTSEEKDEESRSPEPRAIRVSSTACKFYLTTGQCRFGNKCRYSHDPEAKSPVDTAEMMDEELVNSPPSQDTSARACKFFARNGHCRFGERCRNSHDPEMMHVDDEAAERKNGVIVSASSDAASKPVAACKFYVKTGSCRFGDKCHYLHPSEDSPAAGTTKMKIKKIKSPPRQLTRAPVVPCKFFVRTGHCRFGDQCLYLHDAEGNQGEDTEVTGEDENNYHPQEMNMGKNSHSPQGASGSICKFFARTGHCRFGEHCRNLHVAELRPVAANANLENDELDYLPPDDGLSACKFYLRTGHCRFGEHCRYSHDAEVMLADDDIEMRIEISNSPSARSRTTSSNARQQVDPKLTSNPQKQGSHAIKTCRFFRSGKCTQGDSCKFRHLSNASTSEDDSFLNGQNPHGNSPERRQTSPRKQEPGSQPTKACRFFKIGTCTNGENCKFRHTSNSQTSAGSGVPNGRNSQVNIPDAKSTTKQKTKTCRYFKAGKCTQGDSCQFRHLSNTATSEDGQAPRGQNNQVNSPERSSVLSLDEMSVDDLEKLRETEIQQLKKRYRNVEETQEENTCYKFVFQPTDPDWPYDVKALDLSVSFPASYPKEVMQLVVSEQNLPLPVRQQVEGGSTVWLEEKACALQSSGRVELMFRPFLRWLDRNLEDMFTKGLMQYQRELMAAAAGLQFLPASALQKQQESDSSGDVPENTGQSDSEMTTESTYTDGATGDDSSNQTVTKSDNGDVNSLIDPARRGTEVKLLNLQLGDNIATLAAMKVNVIVQCDRCHTVTEVSTVPARVNSVACLKCSREQLVAFRPAIVHAFSPVLGYLDLDGCVAFDLVLPECEFLLSCLSCNKQSKIQGLITGPPKELWCHSCHQKMTIAVNSVRFTQLSAQRIDSKNVHKIEVKVPKKVRDPAIQVGSPLPDDGTCRHYKKSYRWLRFPCCGKAYPCDKCHDENEMDHEMKFANRMICGFCAKEQPFVMEGLCTGCQSSMTRKTTAHWEGGKGCRDKIKMSRGDAKKFANSSKTISRKADQKSDQKPKTTKLRHV